MPPLDSVFEEFGKEGIRICRIGHRPRFGPTPASRRVSPGLETTAETNTVVRPRPALCRGDGGLETIAAKLSNRGYTGVKPAAAEVRVAACGSCQTWALPTRGRQGPNRSGIRQQRITQLALCQR